MSKWIIVHGEVIYKAYQVAIYDVVILHHERFNHACKEYEIPCIKKWDMYCLILKKTGISTSDKKKLPGDALRTSFFISHCKPFKASVKVDFYGLFVLHLAQNVIALHTFLTFEIYFLFHFEIVILTSIRQFKEKHIGAPFGFVWFWY